MSNFNNACSVSVVNLKQRIISTLSNTLAAMNRHYNSASSLSSTLLSLGLLAAVAVSCTESAPRTATLSFDTYTGSRTYTLQGSAKDFMQDSDVVYFDSVSLILPLKLGTARTSTLRDTITQYALGVHGKPVARSIDTWLHLTAGLQGYKIVEDTRAADADVAQAFDIVSGFIVNLSSEMLVYCVRYETYHAGAAHGLTVRRYINYLLEGEGKVLTMRGLFTPEGMKKLPERIAQQAQAISDQIGSTSVSALPADNNFYISSEGEIVFSYQPYEIGSYAQGTIDIPFYPYELVDYMTPEGIAVFHLEDLND